MPNQRRARLKELEVVIASGFDQAVEAGRALLEIRDSRLYIDVGASTFEQYCRGRWSMVVSHAYRQIDAAQIADAISPLGEITPINSEKVGRELAPLLRAGGPKLVAEAWAKVSERYRDQRPPTAVEVHHVLVEEGYRERTIGPSSGKVNRRIRLGQFGDKLIAAEKRLNWFATKELGDTPLAVRDRQLADSYAEKCEALAKVLRALAAGEVPE